MLENFVLEKKKYVSAGFKPGTLKVSSRKLFHWTAFSNYKLNFSLLLINLVSKNSARQWTAYKNFVCIELKLTNVLKTNFI